MKKTLFVFFALFAVNSALAGNLEKVKTLRASFSKAETPTKPYLLKAGMWDCKTYAFTDKGIEAKAVRNTFKFVFFDQDPHADLMSLVDDAETAMFFNYSKQSQEITRSDLVGMMPMVEIAEVVRKIPGKNILVTEFAGDPKSESTISVKAPSPVFADVFKKPHDRDVMKKTWHVLNYRVCKLAKKQ